jgi:hypothetical protein
MAQRVFNQLNPNDHSSSFSLLEVNHVKYSLNAYLTHQRLDSLPGAIPIPLVEYWILFFNGSA